MRPQLIETLRVEPDGRMPLLPWHIERLGNSCAMLDYRWSLDGVQRSIAREAGRLPEGMSHRLRVRVADNGAVEIDASPLPPLPGHPKIGLSPSRLDSREPLLRHKTTHRPWYDAAQGWLAAHPDHFDLLFLNERGELCEGSRTNIYLLIDGEWHTPPMSCGLLPGAQRAALLDDDAVHESVLTWQDLESAQAVRLSNALRGWFDVSVPRTPG